VRSVFPSPFSSEKPWTGSEETEEDSGTGGKTNPAEFSVGKPASGKKKAEEINRATPPGTAEAAKEHDAFAAEKPAGATLTKGAGVNDGPETVTPLEPLPTREEFANQLAEEAARKEREMVEEQAFQAERLRAQSFEDRLSFHNELRQILAEHGKQSGKEIDALVRRSRGDHDPKTYFRARNIWRYGTMAQQVRVTQIRALGVPEADIINFISDNLYARMRTPGGPRNSNEVRVRAAQLLLANELPTALPPPTQSTAPSSAPESRETARTRRE
jgi:hypothetical protein